MILFLLRSTETGDVPLLNGRSHVKALNRKSLSSCRNLRENETLNPFVGRIRDYLTISSIN